MGLEEAGSNYAAAVRAWLERHRRYPAGARMRGAEGTGLLTLTVAADGRVLGHALSASTGDRALDGAIEAMVAAADPLPPIPAELGVERLQLTVPVAFRLR